MERKITPRLIAVKKISADFPYGFRFDYRDPLLEISLEQRGALSPILLARAGEKEMVLVSGHKRVFYAVRKKWKEISAFVMQEKFSEKELYLLSIFSNWNQNMSELDRMEALRKAEKVFGFTFDELREEIMPALGIPPHRGILEEYQEASELSKEIHRLIHEKKLPFKGSALIRRFPREEQTFLASSVFKAVHLTANQLILLSEWLIDLKKIRRVPLDRLFNQKDLTQVLKNRGLDLRARGDKLFNVVRSLRFPRLSAEEKNFRRLKSQIGTGEEINLQRPEGVESEGVLLSARLRDRAGIGRVLSFLENHRGILESYL